MTGDQASEMHDGAHKIVGPPQRCGTKRAANRTPLGNEKHMKFISSGF